MNDKRARRKCSRPRLMAVGAVLALVVCASLFAYARAWREPRSAYALANDLPRGALVYAQCADLPALVKRWHESPLKQQLLGSTALQQFAHRHLGLKLAERWTEYNDAFGFTVDADALAGATANRAAIAIYDIGRLDLVLVAPLSEEQRAAALFFAHTDGFEEVASPAGTTYFRREADTDSGRERQVLAFAYVRGRFVLATSERLLLRTLANIEGRARKDSLADEPAFQTLSRELGPHFATVWVDQAALNRDWYFKNYWVQRNVADLKSLRAGLFDLELQPGKWIEHRRFLLTGQAATQSALPATEAQRLAALLPADAAYYKVRALADATSAAALLSDSLLERAPQHDGSARAQNWNWRSYDDSDFELEREADRYESSYAYLDQSYDRLIDDPVDARLVANDAYYDGELRAATEQRLVAELQQALAPARPLYTATAASPQTNAGPLFVEFRSIAALTLSTPGQFDRVAFERALAHLAQSRLTIAGPAAELQWTDGAGGGSERWRMLTLPMLGRQLCYALSGRELIVSNSSDLLQAVLAAQARPPTDNATHAVAGATVLDELTIVRLTARQQAFDQVFARLDAERVKAYWTEHRGAQAESQPPGPSQEFFSGTVASLLDVAAHVHTIEIRRAHHANRLQEEVEFLLD